MKQRWQVLQEEWNSLVAAAQEAGIPRIREVKIGAESIKYREEKLAALKRQLSLADRMPPPPTGNGQKLGVPDWTSKWQQLSPAEKVRLVSCRHEMPMRNFDITITLSDGSSEILRAQARDILSALATAGSLPTRAWSPDRLAAIEKITWTSGDAPQGETS